MEAWKKTSILLCIFGVLKEFRPSEPYVTKYLNNPPMNFTLQEISNDVYPISIYATMTSLVFVFLLTDFLRYKFIIILDTISAVVVFIMLITVRDLFLVQVLEVFYGLFMAGDVAYYSYIYAKVDKSHYQEVSGYTRAAYLAGRAVSGLFSQIYIIFYPFDYYHLNIFTLVGMIVATLWACFLPPVTTSIYFNRVNSSDDNLSHRSNMFEEVERKGGSGKLKSSAQYLIKDFYSALSNFYVVKWMFWWALATCGYYQVLSYIQVLWEEIMENDTNKHEWNGAVEMLYTILSAIASCACGFLVLDWTRYGELILLICSIVIAFLLMLMSQTLNIFFSYGLYILYAVFYNGMITIANSQIATYINSDSHGLIFGFTTFMALVFQSILTSIVNSSLDLNARTQFVVYGCYFGVLGLVFGVFITIRIIRNCSHKSELHIPSD